MCLGIPNHLYGLYPQKFDSDNSVVFDFSILISMNCRGTSECFQQNEATITPKLLSSFPTQSRKGQLKTGVLGHKVGALVQVLDNHTCTNVPTLCPRTPIEQSLYLHFLKGLEHRFLGWQEFI